MKTRIGLGLVLGVLTSLLLALPVLADGIIVPMPPPGRPAPSLRSLTIKYHHVTVTIQDQVATTRVDQVFVNDLGYEIEGEYLFPLPPGATISRFSMWVDGAELQAQVLEREEARKIYERIVRERRDPALLEYVGRNAFRARIYPIAARGEKRVQLEYTEVLPLDGGLIHYLYPLNTEKFSARPLEQVSVSVDLSTRQPLKAVYSPSHDVVVVREGERGARIGYEESDVRPDKDYSLYYAVADDALGINVISTKQSGEDGYFLLLAAPPAQVGETEILPRDVFLVLDVSGSMRGDKLEQAKRAAQYVLGQLSSEDRFNIIAFSTATRHFAQGPQPAAQVPAAQRFIRELQAGGSTNISRALEEALQQASTGRPQLILFLTDGLPTEGERRVGRILELVDALAGDDLSLFAFGVGYDVNTQLLDRVSQEHHGTSLYVRPREEIDVAVASLYEKISTPVLTDLEFDWGRAFVEEVYPYPLPDLFVGGQLILVGRYREGLTTDLVLHGRSNQRDERYTFEDIRFRERDGADFIPRLWATRKIGYLLSQIEAHGSQRELVDEIIALSVKHGIVTPYTSFLVDEREDALTRDGRDRLAKGGAPLLAPLSGKTSGGGQGSGRAMPGPEVSSAPASGEAAVEKSIARNEMREADRASAPQADQVRTAGGKTFVLRAEVWTDTTYDADQHKIQAIPFGSEKYFALTREHPEWGAYLALGPKVLIVDGKGAYEITDAMSASYPEPTPTADLRSYPAPAAQPEPDPTPKPRFWDTFRQWLGQMTK